MIMKNTLLFVGVVLFVVIFSSCAEPTPDVGAYGFLHGLIHGILMPFAFIASLFMDNVVIYGDPNTGVWYDFAYVLGASIVFGGSGGSVGRRRRR